MKEIAEAISRLNLVELAYLKELLTEDFDGLAGVSVREPRRPLPQSGAALAEEEA